MDAASPRLGGRTCLVMREWVNCALLPAVRSPASALAGRSAAMGLAGLSGDGFGGAGDDPVGGAAWLGGEGEGAPEKGGGGGDGVGEAEAGEGAGEAWLEPGDGYAGDGGVEGAGVGGVAVGADEVEAGLELVT